MDLVASCRDKLTYFRIKDLKDVLSQLAITKQGKKQDLIKRILDLLSDDQATRYLAGGKRSTLGKEGIAKIIDDTYRKIHLSGATNLASEKAKLESNHVNNKLEAFDNSKIYKNVRCPCGHSLITESMVKCEDSTCQVWQHTGCVIVPEKPLEGAIVEVPKQFYCEICRIKRADPFWVTQTHPLPPSLLAVPSIMQDGTNSAQCTQRSFQLSRADKELLQRAEYELQIWCILLNDKVPFRMHWPQSAELQVNGYIVRTTNRPGNQLLGANGRDDGPIISRCIQEGIIKISLSKCDARIFCFGIRIAKRRTVQQVLNLIPKEGEGESFEDALARIRRCVGGGNKADNADSDSDIEVVADTVVFNLRCPMSGSRIKTAGRFKPCLHMGCFDLVTFIELNQRARKWQCPICLKNYSLENVIIDSYFNCISKMLQECDEDVDEIDIKPDGSWRVKGECKDLGQWHLPDGSILSYPAVKREPEVLLQSNQDGLEQKIKDLNVRQDVVTPSLPIDVTLQRFGNDNQQTAFMSSSATGSYRDGEDSSINQEGGGYLDIPTANAYEFDPVLNFGIVNSTNEMVLPEPCDKDVILLSDSEEEIAILTSNEHAYENPCDGTHIRFPFPAVDPGVTGTYSGTPGVGTIEESYHQTFGNGHDFGAPLWPYSTCNQMGVAACTQADSLDLLTSNGNANVETTEAPCSTSCWPFIDGSTSAIIGDGIRDALQSDNYFSCANNAEDGVLLDNPLALDTDPSLQIFLPTQPVGASVLRNYNVHEGISDAFEASGDWISLRLGDSGMHLGELTSLDGLDQGRQLQPKQGRKDLFSDIGALNLSMNGNGRSNKVVSDLQRADGGSRSVKPRLSLSIDIND